MSDNNKCKIKTKAKINLKMKNEIVKLIFQKNRVLKILLLSLRKQYL